MITVLYADDEPALLRIAKLFLEKTGNFQVETALSAAEGLKLIRSVTFDAVVSDYLMPGMDGISFLIEMRKDYPHLPFIIFTGKGREEVAVRAFEEGADFYIQKGGDPTAQFAELAHKITSAVGRRRAEGDLLLLNRLYAVLTATNKAIIYATDKFGLLAEICRIAVKNGNFRMVWAGFADASTQTIVPVASSGYIKGYLELLNISTQDIPAGRGPTGMAYRTASHNVCNDISADPRMTPWRDSALERGYRAVAAFPFAASTTSAGVLTLFAHEPGFFNDQIVMLLDEMCQDISYALTMLEGQERRRAADEALQESEKRFRTMAERSSDLMMIVDNRLKVVYISPSVRSIMGYEPEELVGKPPDGPLMPTDAIAKIQQFAMCCQQDCMSRELEIQLTKKDGRKVTVAFFGIPLHEDGQFRGFQLQGRDVSERKEMEAAMRESKERLRLYLDVAPVLFVILDNDGRIVLVNKKCREELGYLEDELIGRDWFETCIPERIRPELKQVFEKFLNTRTDRTEYYENAVLTRSAEERLIAFYTVLIPDEKGHIVETISAGEDITERNKAERLLRESEERYRRIVETANEGIWMMDEEFRTAFVNQKLAEVFGYTKEEMIGKKFTEFIFPEDQDDHCLKMERRKVGKDDNYERRFRHKDGSERWMLVSATALIEETGEFRGSFAMFTDISALKMTEAALRASEELRSGIVDHLPDPTLVIDDRGRVIAWNHAMEVLTGTPASAMIGKDNYEYAIPFYDKRRPILIDLVFSMDKDIAKLYEFITKEGETLVAETVSAHLQRKETCLWGRASPLYNRKGKLIGAIETIRDITERKNAEDALKKANRQLILLQSITRHDILNQLNILEGLLVLSHDALDDQEAIAGFIREEEKAAKAIERQITFTREYELLGIKEPVWHDLLQTIHLASTSLPMRTIGLKTDIGNFEIYADPLFDKVFYNLIDNALRYGGAKMTTISISAHESDGNLVIVCEDDGVGIGDIDRKHLFQRGYGRNTGLGLFFSRDILSITGLTITETGTEGRGTRFEILVPQDSWRQK